MHQTHHTVRHALRQRKEAYLTANLAVLGFAAAAIIGKKLEAPSDVIVWGRTLFAALSLGVLLLITKNRVSTSVQSPTQLRLRWPRFQLLLTGAVLCAHWFAFFETINLAGVAVALLTFACFPLFVIAFQVVTRPHKISYWDYISAALIIVGIYVMVPFEAESQALRGWAWGIFSAVLFAVLTLQNEVLIKRFDTFKLSFSQNLVACLLLSSTMISLDELMVLSQQQWILLACCGIFCTAIAHTLLIRAFAHLPAVQISFLVNLEPVYGLILAFVLLGETMTISGLAGGLVVILAIVVSTLAHTRKKPSSGKQCATQYRGAHEKA